MAGSFDWQAHLRQGVYASFPEAQCKPVIGITGNYGDQTCKLAETYYKSVVKAGGVPLIIPPLADTDAIINTLERIDGLLLSGGADYNPLYAGEEPTPHLGGINSERDLPELLITQLAYNRQLPMLGVCRGIQTLAMALGGKVAQDLSLLPLSDAAPAVRHSQDADRRMATHHITITEGTLLYDIYKDAPDFQPLPSGGTMPVNSFHHQAVSHCGRKFRVAATAADGVVEAMESTEHKPILGVQWHPECMDEGLPLFRWLVAEATAYRDACRIHERVLTLDTHCDTPMFFRMTEPTDPSGDQSAGIDFASRDARLLVDLHKMTDGRQDATIMAAYVPQPTERPKAYADRIFDQIERIVADNASYLALARTPADLMAHKHVGRKSIMLAIENGLALEGVLSNVDYFARRGVVYITLCHNGDNDICDSARGAQTHGGVSAFGCDVIREMNRCGVMVDLSHAAESTFYDALDISRLPVVCSHSSCRALCDHPRNLTDDQMRRLAAAGGVMQVTLYNGFLTTDGQATIADAMRHLDHAIRVMGIDHVGLGTDFDGDGGVPGLADASELIHFTRQLLARRYSETDIAKVWGGNFLRVMSQVQAATTKTTNHE